MSSPKHIKRNITTKQLKHISVHATYGWIEALLHTDFYIMSYVVDLFKLIEKILTHIAHKSASCIAWARRGIFCVNQTSSFQSHEKKKKKKLLKNLHEAYANDIVNGWWCSRSPTTQLAPNLI